MTAGLALGCSALADVSKSIFQSLYGKRFGQRIEGIKDVDRFPGSQKRLRDHINCRAEPVRVGGFSQQKAIRGVESLNLDFRQTQYGGSSIFDRKIEVENLLTVP